MAGSTGAADRADPNPTPFFARRDALQARDGYAMLFVGALLFWIPVIWPLGVISGVIGALLVLSGRRALGPENVWSADVASVLMGLLGLGLAFVLGLFLGLDRGGRADIFELAIVSQAVLSALFGLVLVFLLSPPLDSRGRVILGAASSANLICAFLLVFVFAPARVALILMDSPDAGAPYSLAGAFYLMRYAPVVYGLAAPFYAIASYRARSRIAVPAKAAPPGDGPVRAGLPANGHP